MVKYDLTEMVLMDEYFKFNPKRTHLRFGQYIYNKYAQGGADSEVFYENNNGVAYTLILKRLNQN